MGNLVWHEYARLVSITASVCAWHRGIDSDNTRINITPSLDAVWASFWGLFYRKFFWDFVGGVLRNPGGLQYVPFYSISIAPVADSPPPPDPQRALASL
jgi:hypothetical protein